MATEDDLTRGLPPGERRCEWCGEVYRPPKATGRRPRYCRRSCRQRAYERRVSAREVEAIVRLRLRSAGPAAPPDQDSSRDEMPAFQDSSRDETGPLGSGEGEWLVAGPPSAPLPPEAGEDVPLW